MVINDLREVCGNCQGTGRKAGITSLGISQINLPGICPICGGRGYQLTELGQDLIDLIRPYILETIEEARPITDEKKAPDEEQVEPD